MVKLLNKNMVVRICVCHILLLRVEVYHFIFVFLDVGNLFKGSLLMLGKHGNNFGRWPTFWSYFLSLRPFAKWLFFCGTQHNNFTADTCEVYGIVRSASCAGMRGACSCVWAHALAKNGSAP